MKGNKGFTLIEVLVAFSIVMMLIMTILPIISLLNNEEVILSDRREITNKLHDNLQPYLWDDKRKPPGSFTKEIHSTQITFSFMKKEKLIKGCAHWENVKKRQEEVCLYGYPEK